MSAPVATPSDSALVPAVSPVPVRVTPAPLVSDSEPTAVRKAVGVVSLLPRKA